MRVDRRLLAALLLSLLAHTLFVSGPGWRLPFSGTPEAYAPLEARLAPGRAALPAPALAPTPASPLPRAAPQPRRAKAQAVAEVPAPAIAGAAPPAGADASVDVPSPAPVAETEAAPAGIPLPRLGRIRFVVTRGEGEQTMLLGQSTHTWRHDGASYAVQAVTETTGLAAVFRPVRVVQSSEGALGAKGLEPQSFEVERNGRAAEGVRFDWEGMHGSLTRGGQPRRTIALAAGAQDLVSQIYQIGLIGMAARIELMIATGKNYGRYAYESLGEEMLATHFGDLRTWHLKTPGLPGEQAMELWLALDYSNLPLRIRYTNRKGEVFDQTAVELETDGARLATKE